MTKTFCVVLIGSFFYFSATTAVAQFSGGVDAALPMSTFSDIAKVGFGASVGYEAVIKDKLSWSGSIGYLSFGGKDFTVGSKTGNYGGVTSIPVSGGINYYLNEAGHGAYATVNLSVSFLTYNVLNPNSGSGAGYTIVSESSSRIGLAPGIGYRMGSWDFTGRFNIVTDFTYLGLRAAYVFERK